MRYESYEDVLDALRSKKGKIQTQMKVKANTYLRAMEWEVGKTDAPPSVALYFYKTPILHFWPQTIVYNSGGYHTATTRERLNDFGPLLISTDGRKLWVAREPGNVDTTRRVHFFDGLRCTYNGVIVEIDDELDQQSMTAQRWLRRQIMTYVNDVVMDMRNDLTMLQRERADCSHCVQLYDGVRGVWEGRRPDQPIAHFLDHLQSGSYNGHLVQAALRSAGFGLQADRIQSAKPILWVIESQVKRGLVHLLDGVLLRPEIALDAYANYERGEPWSKGFA